MIIVDTREKQWSHIQEYFDEHSIEYSVDTLHTGDYVNSDNPKVVIDRKANLQEVCSNLSSGKSNYSRFVKECKRAFVDGMRFIVLVEGTNCKSVKDVTAWRSKYSRHTGKWLANEMFNLFVAYNVQWMFCRKDQTAQKILELLNYDS